MGRQASKKPLPPDPERDRIVAYACRFGAMGALVFKEFENSLDGLPEREARLLKAAMAATIDLAAGDAGLEINIIRQLIRQHRDLLKSTKSTVGL